MTVRALDDGEQAAYLRRLGLDHSPEPTLATLVDLHRHHLTRIPYEHLGFMLDDPPSVDPGESVSRVGEVGRLGYCFHQNGAAELLLRSLGCAVERGHEHVWSDPAEPGGDLTHLVLVVEVPGEDDRGWFDAGHGNGFATTLRLGRRPGARHGRVRVRDRGSRTGRVDVPARPGAGTFAGVSVTSRASDAAAVEAAHHHLSTSSESPFRRVLVCQRRDDVGGDTVRGVLWSRVEPGRREERELLDFDEWRGAIEERIGLSLNGFGDRALRDLLGRIVVAHHEWLATRAT